MDQEISSSDADIHVRPGTAPSRSAERAYLAPVAPSGSMEKPAKRESLGYHGLVLQAVVGLRSKTRSTSLTYHGLDYQAVAPRGISQTQTLLHTSAHADRLLLSAFAAHVCSCPFRASC